MNNKATVRLARMLPAYYHNNGLLLKPACLSGIADLYDWDVHTTNWFPDRTKSYKLLICDKNIGQFYFRLTLPFRQNSQRLHMRRHLTIRVWNGIATKDFITAVGECEWEGKLHEISVSCRSVLLVYFSPVHGFFISYILSGLEPANLVLLESSGGEKARFHSLNKIISDEWKTWIFTY